MVVRELAGELRDEGDEGGRRAREKKKILRKKEERREARERERKGKEYFNERGERSVIKKKISFELQCTSKDRCAL